MPALIAGIHVFAALQQNEDVDGRDKPGHDAENVTRIERNMRSCAARQGMAASIAPKTRSMRR
jgi:hypothetical protein